MKAWQINFYTRLIRLKDCESGHLRFCNLGFAVLVYFIDTS